MVIHNLLYPKFNNLFQKPFKKAPVLEPSIKIAILQRFQDSQV